MTRLLIVALIALPSAALGAPSLSDLQASAEARGDRWVLTVRGTVSGGAADAPVRVWLGPAAEGTSADGEAAVAQGPFQVEVGGGRKRLLPATYSIRVEAGDASGQLSVTVGTDAQAKEQRRFVRQKYESLLDALYLLYRGLGSWGGAIVAHSATAKEVHKGKVPNRLASRYTREWAKYSQVFHRDLPAIRFDHREFVSQFARSYYPQADALLREIYLDLERWRDAITANVFGNLGLPFPEKIKERAKGLSAEAVRDELRAKAGKIQELAGLEPHPWDIVTAGTPERSEDIKDDLFTSSVSGFTVRKPGAEWFFDTSARNPSMRLRMISRDRAIGGRVLSGVELRSYPLAHSAAEVLRVDENQTRNRWPGFELVKSVPLSLDDASMPGGKRSGRLIHYRMQSGPRRFYIVQHALVGRDNKRLFCVMSFLDEALLETWLPTIEEINASFSIQDAP